jgi:hypothetical protein
VGGTATFEVGRDAFVRQSGRQGQSDKDDLTLKTKTLEVTTIKDHDTGTSVSGQIGVSTPGTQARCRA